MMATREYLTALVNLLKHYITDRDRRKAAGMAGGQRKSGVDAEHILGKARISRQAIKEYTDEELYSYHDILHKLCGTERGRNVAMYGHNIIAEEMEKRGFGHTHEEQEFNIEISDVHVPSIISEVTMPFPNEHSCRIEEPGQFQRFRRNNATSPNVIVGFRKDGSSALQAFRYPTSNWTEAKARSHCSQHGGSFAGATKEHEISEHDGKKVSKAAVSYKEDSDMHHCQDCTFFREHNVCELVEGHIYENGTCDLWREEGMMH